MYRSSSGNIKVRHRPPDRAVTRSVVTGPDLRLLPPAYQIRINRFSPRINISNIATL